jgi:CRISPR system Cascade subunit CasC
MRTRLLPKRLDEALKALGIEDEERKAIVAKAVEIGTEKKRERTEEETEETETGETEEAAESATRQLIFFTQSEVQRLAEGLRDIYKRMGKRKFHDADIGKITKEIGGMKGRSVDIAMFGRMTTSEVFDDVQAAVQVAHALSTNRVDNEFDYYTAVDDLSGESGAGMIGDVEFNSATYYKYFSVQWEGLLANLEGGIDLARKSLRALIEAAATANPSGKQNTFAAHNPPDLILVEVRDRNIPLSYANAFIKPCYPKQDQSLMDVSIAALCDYIGRLDKTYSLNGKRFHIATGSCEMPESEQKESLQELLSAVEGRLV